VFLLDKPAKTTPHTGNASLYVCALGIEPLCLHYPTFTSWPRVVRMTLHDKFPAYGGSGPRILGLGIGLGSVATVLVALRVYVRIRITRVGTAALAWSLAAWVDELFPTKLPS
jgi:hypothetical protein